MFLRKSVCLMRRDALEVSVNELFEVVLRERCALTSISALRSNMLQTPKSLEARVTSGSTILTIQPSIHRSLP